MKARDFAGRRQCPTMEWIANYAVLGPSGYVEIVRFKNPVSLPAP